MKYKIATLMEGYAFFWLDATGKTGMLNHKGCVFSHPELMNILYNDLEYLVVLNNLTKGIAITRLPSENHEIKYLQISDFTVALSLSEN